MNQGNYLKSIGFLVRALDHQLPVEADSADVTDPLATGYNSIWNTMRIVSDLMDNDVINSLIEDRDIEGLRNTVKLSE